MANNFRVIATEYKYDGLHFASPAPALDDILPKSPHSNEIYYVSDDLVLPDMADEGEDALFEREFRKMGRFGSTIQATYVSSLVSIHITSGDESNVSREAEARKLDIALQSFFLTLIPPPGKAVDIYCGPFGLLIK